MSKLTEAFDPEAFRREGHQVVDQLADLLGKMRVGQGPVMPWHAPAEELAHWQQRMEEPEQGVADFLQEFAVRSIKLHHPHYAGHQVCAPAPAAALAGLSGANHSLTESSRKLAITPTPRYGTVMRQVLIPAARMAVSSWCLAWFVSE